MQPRRPLEDASPQPGVSAALPARGRARVSHPARDLWEMRSLPGHSLALAAALPAHGGSRSGGAGRGGAGQRSAPPLGQPRAATAAAVRAAARQDSPSPRARSAVQRIPIPEPLPDLPGRRLATGNGTRSPALRGRQGAFLPPARDEGRLPLLFSPLGPNRCLAALSCSQPSPALLPGFLPLSDEQRADVQQGQLLAVKRPVNTCLSGSNEMDRELARQAGGQMV